MIWTLINNDTQCSFKSKKIHLNSSKIQQNKTRNWSKNSNLFTTSFTVILFLGSVSRICRTRLHKILVLCVFGVWLAVVTYSVNVHFIKIDGVNGQMRYLIDVLKFQGIFVYFQILGGIWRILKFQGIFGISLLFFNGKNIISNITVVSAQDE
jgi:hypothetical protein